MTHQIDMRERTAVLWLAAGAAGLISALVFHGPPDPDLSVQMNIIAEDHTRWAGVHWIAAVSLSLFAAAGITMMSSALAVVVIASGDARSETPVTPHWAALAAAFFGAASAFGWIVDTWFYVAIGGPIWLISSLLMNIWLCWFGIASIRQHARVTAPTVTTRN